MRYRDNGESGRTYGRTTRKHDAFDGGGIKTPVYRATKIIYTSNTNFRIMLVYSSGFRTSHVNPEEDASMRQKFGVPIKITVVLEKA